MKTKDKFKCKKCHCYTAVSEKGVHYCLMEKRTLRNYEFYKFVSLHRRSPK